MTDKIVTYINENAITVALTSLPVIGTISTQRLAIGVKFTWEDNVDIRPYNWQVRSKVGAGGWDNDWTVGEGKTINNTFSRSLTPAEVTAAGTVQTITIEARTIDAADNVTATKTANANTSDRTTDNNNVYGAMVNVGNIGDGVVGTDQLAINAITGDKIENNVINSEHIAALAVNTEHLGALQVTLAKMAADSVDGTKIVDDSIDSEHYVDRSIDTTSIALLAITVAEIANTTITVAKLAVDSTLRMFNTNGRDCLDRILYNDADENVPINSLAADDRLGIFVGTNKNVALNKNSVKTDLTLNLVENKTGATIMADELDDTTIVATTTVVLAAAVVAAINANVGVGIANAALQRIKPGVIGHTVLGDMFTPGGYNKIGIYSTSNLTAVAIRAAIADDGTGINNDISNLKTGQNFDDLSNGTTYKKLLVAEQLAAQYAILGLHTTGEQKVGIYSGAVSTPIATVAARVNDRVSIWNDGAESVAGTAALTVLNITGGGVGSYLRVIRRQFVYNSTYNTLYFKCKAQSSGESVGQFRLRIRDELLRDQGAGIFVVANDTTYQTLECFFDISTLGFTDGDLLVWEIEVEDVGTFDLSGGSLTAGTS